MLPVKFKNYRIAKSNDVISAQEGFSMLQQRIITLMCAHIQPEDDEFKEYKIPIRLILGRKKSESLGGGYQRVREAAEGLTKSAINIETDDRWVSYAFITKAEGRKGEGFIRVRFSAEMKPFFLSLKRNYTSYFLKNVYNFRKSRFSLRIYELCIQYVPKTWKRVFDIDKLRHILSIDDKYQRIADLKRFVLDPACSEINGHSDISLEYELLKEGRRFSKVVFRVSPNEHFVSPPEPGEPAFELNDTEAQVLDEVSDESSELPEWLNEKKASAMAERYGAERLAFYVRRIEAKENIESKAGYLYKALKEGYYEQDMKDDRQAREAKQKSDSERKKHQDENRRTEELKAEFHARYERRKQEVLESHDSEDNRFEYMSDIEFESGYVYEKKFLQEWSAGTPSEDALKFYGKWLLKRHGEQQDWDLDTFLEIHEI
ncbi:replication initiation protein [Fulvitalea axinellae]